MIPIDQASSVLAEALGCKPLWTREVDGEVCYRIERFICRGRNLSHPPLAQPVLITHFGGKKVSTTDTSEQVTSFPSVATLVPAGVQSAWAIQSALDFAAVYLRGDALHELQSGSTHITEPTALKSPLCCSITKELVELLGDPARVGKADPRHLQALSSAMLWQLCYELNKPVGRQSMASVTSRFNYVQESLRYIDANLGKSLHSEDVAAQVGLRQSHFRMLFSQVTGTTLHRYILQRRLNQAQELLINSSLSLSEIAAETGFSSQSHMATSFRKHFDVTPAVFRRLQL